MEDQSRTPKVPSEQDHKRQLVERIVRQRREAYCQQAVEAAQRLKELSSDLDLANNLHLSRVMSSAARSLQYGADVLTEMTRDALWSQLGLQDEETEEKRDTDVIVIDVDVSPTTEKPTKRYFFAHLTTGGENS